MNPEKLINNAFFRGLVRTAGFMGARRLLRQTLVPLLVPPGKRDRLLARVAGHLARNFPDRDPAWVERLTRSFWYHHGCKTAEDCVVLNLSSVDIFLRFINDLVVVRGVQNFRRAVSRQGGTLVVGSHVGAVTFGTTAFLSQYLAIPRTRYPVTRFCSEPEVARYPRVLDNLQAVLEDYGGDVRFILTQRRRRDIALEMQETLASGGLVTTNLDVLMGGASRQEFSLLQDRVHLPALVGAARMALATGATILPWRCVRTGAGYRLELLPPIGPLDRLGQVDETHPAVRSLSERLRALLEGWIRDQPAQWVYWDRLHKRRVET